MKREDLLKILEMGMEAGAIVNLQDVSLREIKFQSADGQQFDMVWYCNICTLKLPGFSLWFDDLHVASTHPALKVHLTLFHEGRSVAHIGATHKAIGKEE